MLIPLLLSVSPLTAPLDLAAGAPPEAAPAVAAVADDYKTLLKEAGNDPEKLWALYEWTLEADDRKKYRKRVLNKLVKADPDHVQAREALGHVQFEGKWFDSERALDRHMSKIAKERGLVKYDGKWVGDVRCGEGTCKLPGGELYTGQWSAGGRWGDGTCVYTDGSRYIGQWRGGQRHGKGKYTFASGNVQIDCYEADRPVGQGVKWSADRAQAWELQDGKPGRSISQEEAAQIAARIGLPVP